MTTKKLEDWIAAKATPVHVIAGAKTLNSWGAGHELTEAQYDAGIKAWGDVRIGGEPTEPATALEEDRTAVFDDFASTHTKKKGG